GPVRHPPDPAGGRPAHRGGGDPGPDGPPGHLEPRRLRAPPAGRAAHHRRPGGPLGTGDLTMAPGAATIPEHVPVLLQEVLEFLPVPPGGRVLDLTLGLGGHAQAILARCDAGTRYLGVDRDPRARERAWARLGADARLTILAGTYEDV